MKNLAQTLVSLTDFAAHANKPCKEICCTCSGSNSNPAGFNPKDIMVKHLGEETTRKVFQVAANDTAADFNTCVHLDAALKALTVLHQL